MSIENDLKLYVAREQFDRVTIRDEANRHRVLAWMEDVSEDLPTDERTSLAYLFAASDEMYRVLGRASSFLHKLIPPGARNTEVEELLEALRAAEAHAKGATIRSEAKHRTPTRAGKKRINAQILGTFGQGIPFADMGSIIVIE